MYCASSSSSGASVLWSFPAGPSRCGAHQPALCQGADLAREIGSLFRLPHRPWSQRKAMLLDVLSNANALLREAFGERGGRRPSLQIAIPSVPSTVTRSFRALLPYFPRAGCLTSTPWQRPSCTPIGSIAGALSATARAGEGADVCPGRGAQEPPPREPPSLPPPACTLLGDTEPLPPG